MDASASRSLRRACPAALASRHRGLRADAPLPRRSVKAGGPSENSNATLAAVLQIARLNNIPKARQAAEQGRAAFGADVSRGRAQDLIERNIKRATDKSQADYTEVRPCRGCATRCVR